MSKRDRRARATGRSGFRDHEQYALLPWEAMTADAYRYLPDYAVRVLAALAAQCRKTNNGDVSLTVSMAKECGIARWKLYAGLELLQRTGLVVKTRQGGMRPLGPSLYALTWWPIVQSSKYDVGVKWDFAARNAWAHWQRPAEWREMIKEVERKQRGRGARDRARGRSVAACTGATDSSEQGHGPPAQGPLVPSAHGSSSLTSAPRYEERTARRSSPR